MTTPLQVETAKLPPLGFLKYYFRSSIIMCSYRSTCIHIRLDVLSCHMRNSIVLLWYEIQSRKKLGMQFWNLLPWLCYQIDEINLQLVVFCNTPLITKLRRQTPRTTLWIKCMFWTYTKELSKLIKLLSSPSFQNPKTK